MKDLTGMKFNRLAVESFAYRDGKNYYWNCVCECGSKRRLQGGLLTSGKVVSCGCYNREVITKHGLDGNKLYHVLNSMKHRCDSPKSKSYHRYGGRGITVCDTWRNDPYSFIGWAMTHGYEDGLSIDRIDNDGNYCPENCRWVDKRTQARNTSHNTWLTYKGETKTISEWADEYGINRSTLCIRIHKMGWPIDKALETPLRTWPSKENSA